MVICLKIKDICPTVFWLLFLSLSAHYPDILKAVNYNRMKPPLKLSSSNCVPFRCDFFFTWKNYWLDYIPSCQIVFGCLELKNKKLGDNCVLSCFQLSVVLRYILGSLFQVNMVLGDRCTFTFVEGHANWNEGTTCSAPWSEIHVLASLGSEFLERLQFGRSFLFIYLFILPSPIYTGNLVGQMYIGLHFFHI